MPKEKNFRVAILWRGDREARQAATPANNRFHRVFEELAALGIHAEPAVYDEDFADEVREQLLSADGVLVWVDPIHDGKTRDGAGPAIARRCVARALGQRASRRHPQMGVKEVLYRTKHLGWGYRHAPLWGAAEFRDGFPARLQSTGPRVLKQNRGNGGQGVWKVELVRRRGSSTDLRVLHALRGSVPEELPLNRFMGRCEAYFGWGGCIIDQPFQPRLPDGMIRCYMGARPRRGLWAPVHQGADRSAAGRPGCAGGAARSAHHARSRCCAVSGAAHEMEVEWMPQMIDMLGRFGGAADHLGRRFPLRAARCGGG